MAPGLVNLHQETQVRIFAHLNFRELAHVQRLCKATRSLIKNSDFLQYMLALGATGSMDGTASITLRRKLRAIKYYEDLWKFASLNQTRKVDVSAGLRLQSATSAFDLSGCFLFFGDGQMQQTRAIRRLDLRRCMRDPAVAQKKWPELDVGTRIVDFGFALEEHDLLVLLTYQNKGDKQLLKLCFVRFSTGTHHPAAVKPVVRVAKYPPRTAGSQFAATIEVVGDYLVMLVTLPESPCVEQPDVMYLYNWKLGEVLQKETATQNTWFGFIFLSPESIAVPNRVRYTIDVFHISPFASTTGSRMSLIRCLDLPSLGGIGTALQIDCRAYPNPFGRDHTSRGYSRKALPFTADPACAVSIFSILIQHTNAYKPVGHTFIVHRAALLRAAYMSNYCGKPIPWNISGAADVPPLVVPWASWGPHQTRWCTMDEEFAQWIITTTGQRQVLLKKGRIHIRDFNPRAVQRGFFGSPTTAQLTQTGVSMKVVRHPTYLEPGIISKHRLASSLPYVEISAPMDLPSYDGVMMDEEHVLGIKINHAFQEIEKLDVYPLTIAAH